MILFKINYFPFLFYLTGKVCPSPLLGVCPLCENCNKNNNTITPAPPSKTPQTSFPLPNNTSDNTFNNVDNAFNTTSVAGGGLPGKETDPGPFENYQGPENKGSTAPASPKLNEENKGNDNDLFPSNLPKNWRPKHLKSKQI